jgi:hypothetical protein
VIKCLSRGGPGQWSLRGKWCRDRGMRTVSADCSVGAGRLGHAILVRIHSLGRVFFGDEGEEARLRLTATDANSRTV